MENEGSIGLVTRKMKKKIIADFHVLEHDLSDKKISVCDAPLPPLPPFPLLDKFFVTPTASSLEARVLKFWLPGSFEPTRCTSYSEF
jgi:hypothetical protein